MSKEIRNENLVQDAVEIAFRNLGTGVKIADALTRPARKGVSSVMKQSLILEASRYRKRRSLRNGRRSTGVVFGRSV